VRYNKNKKRKYKQTNKMKSKVNDVKKGLLDPTLSYCRSNHTPKESVLLWNAYIAYQCKGFPHTVEYYEYKYNRGVAAILDSDTWEAFDYIDSEIAKENAASNPLKTDGALIMLDDNGKIEIEYFST
jgi:hypothetical protein